MTFERQQATRNHSAMPPAPRVIGRVNWGGLQALYMREVRRFMKVWIQTIASPAVTQLLFLAVFMLALGRGDFMVQGIPFPEFLAPGLVIMAIAQNAFQNTSSSVASAKIQGNIVDTLMPPLGPFEMIVGYIGGAITRGVFVGVTTGVVMMVFVGFPIHDPALILFHTLAAGSLLGLIGLIGGIWAEKFDHISAVTNFIITPLSFLSGTFYSTSRLPGVWQDIAHLNPFFYMIDGFRAGFLGVSDGSLTAGIFVMLAANLLCVAIVIRILKTGWKLKG
ncbi:MAG: ABC transporter permease [Alphaproteobacteria bacterium]|nr:ABC transporter permease [Alphaproteobacteria bacterium]